MKLRFAGCKAGALTAMAFPSWSLGTRSKTEFRNEAKAPHPAFGHPLPILLPSAFAKVTTDKSRERGLVQCARISVIVNSMACGV